jgi:hypothetical protein
VRPAERVALALGRHFAELHVAAMARHPAFRAAVDTALAVVSEATIVEHVVALGGLSGSVNPHAVIVGRLRALPGLEDERLRLADEEAEARRWRRVDSAAGRGETMRQLVEAGHLYGDEAVETLCVEYDHDDDLREIALAALRGGRQ